MQFPVVSQGLRRDVRAVVAVGRMLDMVRWCYTISSAGTPITPELAENKTFKASVALGRWIATGEFK